MIRCNIFQSSQKLSDQKLTCQVYKISNVPHAPEDERFRVLNRLAYIVSDDYAVPCTSLTSKDDDFLVAVSRTQIIREDIIDRKFPIAYFKQGRLDEYPTQAERVFYQISTKTLEEKGLWEGGYHRFYEFIPENTLNEVTVYRGLFFRFDCIDQRIFLTIDPITRIVTNKTLWDLVLEYGTEKVVHDYLGRSMLAENPDKKSLCTLAAIDQEHPITMETFEIRGRRYSVRSYLDEKGPGLSKMVVDEEPTVIANYDEKVYHMAASLLNPILPTDEVPDYAKEEVYLAPDRRRRLTQKYLSYLATLSFPEGVQFTFTEPDASLTKSSGLIHPPKLKFGRDSVIEPSIEMLRGLKKRALKEHGPEHAIRFLNHLVLVYPNLITAQMAMRFYRDCQRICRNYLRTELPSRPKLWEYEVPMDIQDDYYHFQDQIDALLVVVPAKRDEKYYAFKDLFIEKPNQVLTYRLVNERYTRPRNEMGYYFDKVMNACAGLLAKMGCRPWILAEALTSSVYVGIDIGGRKGKVLCYGYVFDQYGRNLGIEQWGPQTKEAIDASDIKGMITRIIREKAKQSISKLIVHRDGELAKSERQGIREAVQELIAEGKMAKEPIAVGVELRKTVPFRLYEIENGNVVGCYPGSYLILDERRAIIATTGAPLLRQGMARPLLIEAVPVFGEESIVNVIRDVYFLANLNWGSITNEMKLPVTVKYAEDLVPLVEKGIYSKILPL